MIEKTSLLKRILNWMLLFAQFIAAIALAVFSFSEEPYQELSNNIVGPDSPLMGSHIFDLLISWPFSVLAILILFFTFAKEFRVALFYRRVYISLGVLTFQMAWGVALMVLYFGLIFRLGEV